MSKDLITDQPYVKLESAKKVRRLADLYRPTIQPASERRLEASVRELGIEFTPDELSILAALDTPERVQEFINTQLYYNNDHASGELEETAMSPRQVLQTGLAHCFEGAMFAYTVNYLHAHMPRLLLLEACQDSAHNLVVFQDHRTGLYGCNAHSRYPYLDGRLAQYSTIRTLAESYYPYYYSDHTNNPNDLTLVGYSELFDLRGKFGVAWMGSQEPLWDIYYNYVDDTIIFYKLFDDSGELHLYPGIQALKSRWIQFDAQGRPFISVADLPREAQELWNAFWRVFDAKGGRPLGAAREIEEQFRRLTHTTPIDLQDDAKDLVYFLERGYHVEQMLTQPFK
jgi:hypothetical protein